MKSSLACWQEVTPPFYGDDPKYGLVRFGSTVKKIVEMKSPKAYR